MVCIPSANVILRIINNDPGFYIKRASKSSRRIIIYDNVTVSHPERSANKVTRVPDHKRENSYSINTAWIDFLQLMMLLNERVQNGRKFLCLFP